MRPALLAAAVLLSGCQTIPLGEGRANYYGGQSRNRFLHVLALPAGRKLIWIRDNGWFFCWGNPKSTKCKPEYTGTGLRTRDTSLDP